MRLPVLLLLGLLCGLSQANIRQYSLPSPWSYQCDRSNSSVGGHFVQPRCVKVESNSAERVTGLNACKLTCGPTGLVWPKPKEMFHEQGLVNFLPQDFEFESVVTSSESVSNLVHEFIDIFKEYLLMKNPDYEGGYKNAFQKEAIVSTTPVRVRVEVTSPDSEFVTDTDESYSLEIMKLASADGKERIEVRVSGKTFYGARNGLETLSQMIAYDDPSDTLLIYTNARVTDEPTYPHRGLLIDTSRNFMKVAVLKQIISAMSYDKLNVLHWHITDTHSFPLYSRRVPQLTLNGAYSARQVYSPENVRELVDYGRVRGVRVLPEFDAPAHVGNGWQFGEKEGLGRLALCLNQEPWQDYCVEPPCGQLNPVNDNVYTTLGKLYEDFFELFPTDMFHMGGDEVNFNCWNTSTEIRNYLDDKGQVGTEDELLQLWIDFQNKAADKVYSAAGQRVPLILWTSTLTASKDFVDHIDKNDYIIQIWEKGTDEVIGKLIDNGYRVLFSNSDAWYLDCGYSAWVGEGNNWCSPYKGWQIVYDNNPRQMYRDQGGNPELEYLILGGEAAMWSEQVDGAAVMHKVWPRASALAERLWSDPTTGWKQAEIRMVSHRENLVRRGVQADALQPEWCNQNEGLCYVRV